MAHTNTLLYAAAQTGALDGDWYAVPRTDRTHIPIAISIQAGSATWVVQGRNSANDDALELDTGSGDEAISVLRMNQMRVILTAAAGATVRATADIPMLAV